jgi:uncharacterized protein (TIGR02421 family)
MMSEALQNIHESAFLNHDEKTITGEQAAAHLQERFASAFVDPPKPIRIMLSDEIVSDAAAGADYLKIRREARFSQRDLRLLEIHEGWVHLGTTLNGLAQPVCSFLSKGPPSATITQEGLAIVTEVLAFASNPDRLRRVTNRIRGVRMAEEGANFLDVFNFYRQQGLSDEDGYAHAVRVFRGSTPTGGPFTKDLSYSKGFILVYNFLRLAVRKGRLDRIPLLFCGKTTLEDIGTLSQLASEGLLTLPKYIPPPFADLNALTAWMCYSNFLNRVNLGMAEADFASIL